MQSEPECKTYLQIDQGYFKILYLINAKATEMVRGQFTSLWTEVTGEEWINEEGCGRKFAEGIGKEFVASCKGQRIQRESIASGNVETWDLALLSGAIKTLFKSLKRAPLEKDITLEELNQLKKIRNKLAHLGTTTIEPQDFDKFWTTAVEIMQRLGLSQEEIDAASNLKVEDERKTPSCAKEEEEKVSTLLKEKGNLSFKEKDYKAAIDSYTSAIYCDGVSSTTLAVLYSNRSASFIALGKLDEAKEDAKRALILNPYWSRGYYRLASVYKREDKFWKALMQYQMCLSLEPDNRLALDDVKLCKQKLDPLGFDGGGVDATTVIQSVQDPSTFIRDQAQAFANCLKAKTYPFVTQLTVNPKLDTIPPNLIGLKPIGFQKMDKCKEAKVYKGFAIQLKAVTDVVCMSAAAMIVMDDSGHFGRVGVYDYPSFPNVQDEIGFGCSFTIVNPYYKRAVDGKMAIRVDDPNCLVKTPYSKDTSICRFCFKPGADFKCRRCFRAKYCSRKCCKEDLEERSHELVCVKKI